MPRCRVCGSPELVSILDLGQVPLANSFRAPDDSTIEPLFDLGIQWCGSCAIVQLTSLVDPETLFRHYLYTPSASATWIAHCEELASWMWERSGKNRDAFVVEPASNDGALLKKVRLLMPRILGVEPARNIAELALADGIPTLPEFFGVSTARQIRKEHGPADIVVGTNVLAHVPNIVDFLVGARELLNDDGIVVIEAPYLPDLVDRVAFDTIYHEHVSYLSVTALDRIYRLAGLNLTSVERTPVHGGSIRFTGGLSDVLFDASVRTFLHTEAEMGYADGTALTGFAARVDDTREQLREVVSELRASGLRIAGYGATAKGNTLLTTSGLDSRDIEYIVDKNPMKVGLVAPGTAIPIVGVEYLNQHPVDVLLILAWNLSDEIIQQQQAHRQRGGRFLIPLPSPWFSE